MKIEHIAMYVSDLESAKDFFVNYLGGKANNVYHNKKTETMCITIKKQNFVRTSFHLMMVQGWRL